MKNEEERASEIWTRVATFIQPFKQFVNTQTLITNIVPIPPYPL